MATQARNGEYSSGPPQDKFGKPGTSYPTPNVDDYVVVEQVPIEKGQYKRLRYGTPHPDFQTATLVSQKRSAGDDNKVLATRVYATPRVNQGAYNFSLSWALNSKAHLIVTRSSLVLRSDYVTTATVDGVTQVTVHATPNFTPDVTFSTALLVSETAAPAESPYDTLYLRVTRTFEAIAGPLLTGEEFTKIGRTLTLIPPEFLGNQKLYTSTQIVLPGTQADAQDSVDDSGHIVVSSIVTPIDATHSSKSNVARENTAYPTLHNSGLESEFGGAVGTTARSIVAAGTQPPQGYLVIDSSEKALSATETLQEAKTVTEFPDLVGAEFDSNIPEKFLAAFSLETDTDWIDTTVTPATAQLASGSRVISCKITPETTARAKRVTTRLPAGATLPTLTSVRRTAKGQYATTVESITDGSTPLPTLTGLVEDEASQVAIGGGNFLRTVTTVSEVFAAPSYTVEIPNLVPEEFRALATATTTESTTAGVAAPPTLGAGEFRRSVSQVDEQLIRAEVTALNLASLPITLASTRTNAQKQAVTVVRTLQLATGAVPSVTALQDVNVTNLGNGLVVVEVSSVSAVFSGIEYTAERPNTVPEEFRALAVTSTVATTGPGTAAMLTLGTGEFHKSVRQVDAYTIRTETTSLNIATLPITITGTRTNDRKQVIAVSRTLEVDTTTPTAPDALTEGTFTKLGSGLAIEQVETISAVFSAPVYSVEIADATPEEFRVLTPTLTSEATVTGTAGLPTLGTGELRRSEQQIDAFLKRVTVTYRNLATLPATLTSTRTNAQKQAVTVTRTLQLATASVPAPSATVDVRTTNLGNGTVVVEAETIGAVFAGAEYAVEIPNAVPEEFRAAATITTTGSTAAGTASAPTLGTGQLRKSIRQLDAATVRTEITALNLAALPITLTSTRTDGDGQVNAVTRTLQLATDAVPTPDATTRVSTQNLGTGLVVVEVVTKPEVFLGSEWSVQRNDPTPGEFDTLAPVYTAASNSPGTVSLPVLDAGDVRRSLRQVDEFTVRSEVVTRDLSNLPVTVSGSRTNEQGEVETVTRTLQLATADVPAPTALTTVQVSDLANGTVVVEVVTLPEVFSGVEYTAEKPNPVPEEFRALALTTSVGSTVTGTAAAPTLGTGEYRKTARQVTKFLIRTETTALNLDALPISFSSTRTNADGQIETVTRTLQLDTDSVPAPDATTRVDVTNLGNGLVVVQVIVIPEVFSGEEYSAQRNDAVPEAFHALVPVLSDSSNVAGTAAMPTLATGELRKTSRQETEFTVRVERTYRAVDVLPITLTGKRTNSSGQVETVTRTLQLVTASVPSPDALNKVTVDNLGNGMVVVEVGTIAAVFAGTEYTAEGRDLVPAQFNAAIPKTTTATTSAGTAGAPTLSLGDIRKSNKQVDAFLVRAETERRDISALPLSLVSRETNERKQIVTITETLRLATGSATNPDALTDDRVQNLGGGLVLETVRTINDIFVGYMVEISITDATPEEFRALLQTTQTVETLQGTAGTPTLSTGDVSAREEQIDAYLKRVSRTTRNLSTTATLMATELENGQSVTITKTLKAGSQSFTANAFTLDGSAVRDLGNGYTLMTLRTVTSYPTLQGQSTDPKLGLALPYTSVNLSPAAAAASLGVPDREIIPKTGLLSEVRDHSLTNPLLTTDPLAILDAYYKIYRQKVARIDGIPDVLVAVPVEWNTSNGSGDSTETADATTAGTSGHIDLNLPASAEGSASIIPSITPIVVSFDLNNRSVADLFFFIEDNSSESAILSKASVIIGDTVHDWPLFQPVSHTIVAKGETIEVRASARTTLSVSFGPDSVSRGRSQGTSASAKQSLVNQTATIKPTIHGAITVGATSNGGNGPILLPDGTAITGTALNTSQQASVTSTAASGIPAWGLVASRTVKLTAKASVSPKTLAATPGVNAVPAIGLHALDINSEPYRESRTLVRVRVFDFGTLTAANDGHGLGTNPPVDTVTVNPLPNTPVDTGVSSTPGTFTEVTPPSITTDLVDKTVRTGTTVRLVIAATGAAPLAFQWFKDGAAITGARGSSYVISSPSPADAGAYTVQVSNNFGSVTSAASNLTVNTAITITTQPTPQTANVGDSVTFTVVATGTTLAYQWKKDGTNISGETTDTYNVPSVATGDAGVYKVDVTNVLGHVLSHGAALSVNVPATAPTIVTQPSASTAAMYGGSLSLSVAVNGTTPFTYQWYKGAAAISGATASTFNVASLVLADADTYSVVITNGVGSVTSSNAVVTVSETAPTITSDVINQRVVYGATTTLAVTAAGDALTYQWHDISGAISGATARTLAVDTSTFTAVSGSAYSLHTYYVEVSNAAGMVTSSTATVIVVSTTAPTTPTLTFTNPREFYLVVGGGSGGTDIYVYNGYWGPTFGIQLALDTPWAEDITVTLATDGNSPITSDYAGTSPLYPAQVVIPAGSRGVPRAATDTTDYHFGYNAALGMDTQSRFYLCTDADFVIRKPNGTIQGFVTFTATANLTRRGSVLKVLAATIDADTLTDDAH